ncbi:MAG: hypothetical protein IPJ19_20685 [Planctomycetes bacterium]|nr:hypothetical protein [Planctomycetota bacterium]
MREFLGPANRGLATLQPSTRFTLGLLLVFALASYAVMAALGLSRSGLGPDSIATYYGGAVSGEGKSTGELLELTHFHLFAMPLFLFVLGHVFLLCGTWSPKLRRAIVLAAFAGAACDLCAPWLVIHVSPLCAWVKIAGRALLAPALLALTLVPLWEITRAAVARR